MNDNKLNLYVPKSKQRRQVCLSRQLPIMLLKHLGVENSTGGREMGPIITASSLFVVDELLEDAGIIELDRIEGRKRTVDESSSSNDEEDPANDPQTLPSGQRMGVISPDMIS
jgi:hypothetical protein